MSGSKLLRLCSLCLCLLLLVANFSVVANAAEDTENLVDSDIRNWTQLSSIDSSALRLGVGYSNLGYYYINSTSSSNTGDFGALYSLANLNVGYKYKISFDYSFNDYSLNNLKNGTYHVIIGFGHFDENNNLISDEGHYYELSDLNSQSLQNNLFYNVNLEFTYEHSLSQQFIFIYFIQTGAFIDTNVVQVRFNNFSLSRVTSETEKKLDGILGWLKDIKDSIVGLPTTIKTNFQTFFTDLQSKITDMKDGVVTKLGNISTEFSGYITGLGDRVSSFFTDLKENISAYFTDLWNKFSEFFEKFKPRINVDFNFKRGYFNHNTNEFVYDTDSRYYLSDVIVIPKGCEMHLTVQVPSGGHFRIIDCTQEGSFPQGGRYYTYYSDFDTNFIGFDCIRIEYMGSLYDGYIDKGWFTYFTYTLRHKIDIKIEEIKISIHDFFVPPEGFFEEWKVTFDLMLSDNLGFIYQAPNFVIDIVEVVQEILQSDQEVNLVFPAVEFDIAGYHIELFKDTKVDFSFLEAGIWLTLYSMYKVILYVIFALALIKYGMSTWERTMSN